MAKPISISSSLIRVEPIRLADQAHKGIRDAIIDGRFEMGSHLSEPALAKTLGMSRAPIREALRRLAEEGLVIERANHGSIVCSIGAAEVINIYNVRLALESLAIRLFILQKANTRVLWNLIDKMDLDATRKSSKSIVRHELQFHEALIEGSMNPYLVAAFSRLSGQVMMALSLDASTFENLQAIADEHRPVVAAIESKNPDRAAKAIQEHIVSTVENAITRLGGNVGTLLKTI